MVEVMPYIFKRKSKMHPATGIVEDKQLTVQCQDFDKVKEEFDK